MIHCLTPFGMLGGYSEARRFSEIRIGGGGSKEGFWQGIANGWLMVVVPLDGGGETGGCVSGVGGEEIRDSVGRQAGEGIWAEAKVDWEWAGSGVKGIWAGAGVVADQVGGVPLLDEAV
uniref:Uncharacterized protein n=1 Tax=Fagus sylvatica TaxID=28930 RepID=A0A2N9G6E3_FAGSY